MRFDNNSSAAVLSVTPQSDAATQRDYLLSRLSRIEHYDTTRKAFNLDVNNNPKTYKELIDAIKNDLYTLDAKRTKRIDDLTADDDDEDCLFGFGPFDGIIWNGPQPDYKGYEAARVEQGKQYTAAKDIIMTGDAAAGLKALQAYEAWTPTVATTTAQ